jgi:signal transduction histidine kinase
VRIARELHDVVAHSLGVMTVQAGAARLVLDADPGRAEESLLSVEETGREALAEMRRLLGLLDLESSGTELEPQPTLLQVGALADQLRDAGLAVDLRVEGAARSLSPGVDLTAYRIVQESLTNVLKHAGSGTARVTVAYRSDTIEIEVEDDGHGRAQPAAGGHGLVGMRERAAMYGGTLVAGPRPLGGFAVRATIPFAEGAR